MFTLKQSVLLCGMNIQVFYDTYYSVFDMTKFRSTMRDTRVDLLISLVLTLFSIILADRWY